MPAIGLQISGILALIVGILILVWPKVLRVAVAIYLIVIGILSIIG